MDSSDLEDSIVSIVDTPETVMKNLAEQARTRRLQVGLTQEGLASRSGVSYGTLKKFERTGQISLQSLLKIALVLDVLDDFKTVFVKKTTGFESLDEVLKKEKHPQRGRIK
jgi:transcriptional regulator with XRE-family HTH domain